MTRLIIALSRHNEISELLLLYYCTVDNDKFEIVKKTSKRQYINETVDHDSAFNIKKLPSKLTWQIQKLFNIW